ncbi:MAG: hypothetical protein GC134_03105 [Proteobacteria bacterium]|nr:hypothetical protein [Pseudomonadota bacterium]
MIYRCTLLLCMAALFTATMAKAEAPAEPSVLHVGLYTVQLSDASTTLASKSTLSVTSANGVKMIDVDAAQELTPAPDGSAVFFLRQGGNAAGWGVYRYQFANQKLDYFAANAREIKLSFDGSTAVLQVALAHHSASTGYQSDTIQSWRWESTDSSPAQALPHP